MKAFNIIEACLFVLLFEGILDAQTTSIQLPSAADSSSSFRVLNSNGTPRLRINSDGGFYVSGSSGEGFIPAEGEGSRLMWHPSKGAFRAGYVDASQWDNANIGSLSIATGLATMASGDFSTAMGSFSTATGTNSAAIGGYATANGIASIAFGFNTTAGGNTSTAMGSFTSASGDGSTAMGYQTTASGLYSTSMGYYSIASGSYSTAIGYNSTAGNLYATALGYNVSAGSSYSTALGVYIKTNHNGAFVIGDHSKVTFDSSSADNEMTMRFAGGYRLFTNVSCTNGVYMNADQNGWTNYCDRNKKENFRSINGEQILEKIKTMPITEWNYRGTDKSVKYIGPVAQDFYSAFHLGGTDSLGINSICIDGVNMAAIQALEKRTAELKITLDELKKEKENTMKLQASFEELKKEIAIMKNDIQLLTEVKTGQTQNNISLNTINKGQ